MIRIKDMKVMDRYHLEVLFDDGASVLYDVGEDIDSIAEFEPLKTQPGLFECPQLDESRTCVYWNDRIDLPSDTIREYGVILK